MHDLINFACEELEDLERKAKDKKMSMSDVQYADMLAHLKKNLLASEGMMGSSRRSYDNSYARMGRDGDGDGRYSEDNFRYSPYRGGSYNYSGMNSRHSMVETLEQMAQAAVDEHERRVLMDCMNKLK